MQQKPKVKGKVYKLVVRPAMLYSLEVMALMKRQETELREADLKMFMFFARSDMDGQVQE